jgi:RimJ/RimL family protein N-acetyltransferase
MLPETSLPVGQNRRLTAILETRRLRLREFRPDDLDELAAMVADEEQMRFYPGPRTRDEAAAWIGRNLSFYEQHGFGFWLIEARETQAFLGYCGIRPLELEGRPGTEIGWHTQKASWNRGIATEAAAGVRDAAFGRFAQTRLVALIDPDHLASRRVADKIGMREEGAVVVDGDSYLTYACELP